MSSSAYDLHPPRSALLILTMSPILMEEEFHSVLEELEARETIDLLYIELLPNGGLCKLDGSNIFIRSSTQIVNAIREIYMMSISSPIHVRVMLERIKDPDSRYSFLCIHQFRRVYFYSRNYATEVHAFLKKYFPKRTDLIVECLQDIVTWPPRPHDWLDVPRLGTVGGPIPDGSTLQMLDDVTFHVFHVCDPEEEFVFRAYEKGCVSGTFDNMHCAHQIMLSEAALHCKSFITIGVHSDAMIKYAN